MSSQREKELKRLIYLRNEIIKEQKKELKELRRELEKVQGKPKQKMRFKKLEDYE